MHLHKGAGGTFWGQVQHHTFSLGASTAKGYSYGVQFEGVANARPLSAIPKNNMDIIQMKKVKIKKTIIV